jgi:hypothetical protein
MRDIPQQTTDVPHAFWYTKQVPENVDAELLTRLWRDSVPSYAINPTIFETRLPVTKLEFIASTYRMPATSSGKTGSQITDSPQQGGRG